jgi:ubiquitin-like-conjugating enzyme ATG3
MAEYADKTVTYEYHPHLNIYMATIHPCRHADTLKLLTQQMLENGATKEQIHADNAILIFLKFMGSVIPTISFDFVSEVVIG